MEEIYCLPVQSDPDISATDGDLIVIPFSDWMYDQRTVSRALEGVDGTGSVDRRIVWTGQLVDLYLEAEVDADVGGVVVAFVPRVREADKYARIVVGCRHHPLQPQYIAGGRRSRKPQQAQIRPGPALQHTPSNPEGAGVVAPRLVADRRHRPVAEQDAVEQAFETRVCREGRGAMMKSPVRRDSAIPVSIGLGEPMLGKSAGPAAYRLSV